MKKQKDIGSKIYKLICKDFGHMFSFHAKDDTDAMNKKWDWCNYHSHSYQDYRLEETTEEKWIHDEYFN